MLYATQCDQLSLELPTWLARRGDGEVGRYQRRA
jgi:hypothetical protein